MGFIKTGQAALDEVEKANAQQAAAMEGNVNRFYLPKGGKNKITFLDGELIENNSALNLNAFYEHNIYMNGSWRNWFRCVKENEPCPMCDGGDKPSLVAAFTIIEHGEWKDKQGNVRKDEVKLFVCKRQSISMLQIIALEHNGLQGCTLNVYRNSEKEPNVGGMFSFVGKSSMGALKKKFNVAGPLVYEDVLPWKDAKELRKLGFGQLGVGTEMAVEEDEDEDDIPFDAELAD